MLVRRRTSHIRFLLLICDLLKSAGLQIVNFGPRTPGLRRTFLLKDTGGLRPASRGRMSSETKVYSLISNSVSSRVSQSFAFMTDAYCGRSCRNKKGRVSVCVALVRSTRSRSLNTAFSETLGMPVEGSTDPPRVFKFVPKDHTFQYIEPPKKAIQGTRYSTLDQHRLADRYAISLQPLPYSFLPAISHPANG